jgi:hypothetical protein
MMRNKAQQILSRNKDLKRRKETWSNHYQLIGEYIMLRKQQFQTELQPGEFLTDRIYDTTAIEANEKMTASLLGALWPNGARTFRYIPVEQVQDSEAVKEYFERATRIAVDFLDDTEAGLAVSLEEYMRDQGGFGTSGLALFENNNPSAINPLLFKSWDVKSMAIDEGENGRIDTVYNESEMTVRQAVKKYGLENLSKVVQDKFINGKTEDRVIILHAIEPRIDGDPLKYGAKDMPIASIHIETQTGKIIKESGFDEMPVFVTRFSKAMREIYGRSPAMRALPDIIEINAIWESAGVAIEKLMNPPMGVYEDGTFGGGVVDTSPGALNVVSTGSRLTSNNPIWQIQTVGDIRPVEALIAKLEQSITAAFMIDRLLDLNNDVRMTAFEANIRNQFRGESLGTIYKRQETELFTPMLNRVFNILFKKGFLGVVKGSQEEVDLIRKGIEPIYIPEELLNIMATGQEFYKIQYVSPAKRIMQSEEAQGILTTFNFAAEVSAVAPQALDNIDVDKAVKKLAEISGIPTDIINSTETVMKLRKLRAQQQAQAAQMEQAREASEVARNMAQAEATSNKVDQNLAQ